MNGLIMIAIGIIALGLGYLFYGRWLVKTWGIDPERKTPAYTKQDGDDYIPTPKGVVFSHQFSSIAGAGPVTGPIIAAMFGWLPVLIWLLVGGIFFGAVHDFGALYASVKEDGKSIGEIVEQYIGKTGRKLFFIFAWVFSLLVIAAFADMVAGTFNGFTAEGNTNYAGGAAASISMLFIVVAVLFGLFIKYKKPSQKLQFVIGVVLLVAMLVAGIAFPIILSKSSWLVVIFIYLFLAAITPMWILMQPRDYLSTFLLIGMILAAVVGVIVNNPPMNLPAFTGFEVNGKYLFPTLFVTIACGAVSGFHSLVSSETSSKTVKNEKDMLFIGYGAMNIETLLGVIALIVVGSAATNGQMPKGTPFSIFSSHVATFLQIFGIPSYAATCIMTMCVSALALTSLDSVGRIGRMSLQEFFYDSKTKDEGFTGFKKFITNKYVATILTLGVGALLSLGGYNNVWPLFGAANQLLSALVLITLSVFLKTTHRKGAMLWAPMFIMLAVTFTSLIQSLLAIIAKMGQGKFAFLTDGLQLIFAILLIGLGLLIAVHCLKKLFGKDSSDSAVEA